MDTGAAVSREPQMGIRGRLAAHLAKLGPSPAPSVEPPTPSSGDSTGRQFTGCRLAAGSLLGIVGESHYQPAIIAACPLAGQGAAPYDLLDGYALEVAETEPELRWFDVALIPEPDNPYDPNAVRVAAVGGDTLGYLSRDNAVAYKPVLDAVLASGVECAVAPAFIRFGPIEGANWAVVIALSIPRICLDELERRRREEAELARLDERVERLPAVPVAERELESDRLAHDASVLGVTFEQIASELGLASASEAEAAAQRHQQRSA